MPPAASHQEATLPAAGPRRLTAAAIDATLTALSGLGGAAVALALRPPSDPQAPIVPWWASLLTAALAFSFCNHVLLTCAARASIGKALSGLRVARVADGGRPGPLRLVGRWLFGFYWTLVFVPVHLASDSDVEQQDALGLRVVRWRG